MFLLGHGPIHCGTEPPDLCVKQENWMLNISSHYLHMSFCGEIMCHYPPN